LYLRNAALLVPAVIIKLTRRREGGIREGRDFRGEGIRGEMIGEGDFERIYFSLT
jgi:hypothetical protein